MNMRKLVLFIGIFLTAQYSYAVEGEMKYFVKERKWLFEGYLYNYANNAIDTVITTRTMDGPFERDGRWCYTPNGIPEGAEEWIIQYYWEDGLCLYRREAIFKESSISYEWKSLFDGNSSSANGEFLKMDTILSNDIMRRRWWFTDDIWVEGIGSLKTGPFGDGGLANGTNRGGRLFAVYDGDECIFTLDDFTKEAYHSEPNDIKAVLVSNSNNGLFDLQGRRIQGEPQGQGVSVKNGKKIIMK